MKKIQLLIFIGLLSLMLVGCKSQKTYSDLYQTYANYVSNNQEIYQTDIDYFNHVSEDTIRSVVLVEKTIFNAPGSATGSGVIIKADDQYYYVLTNNHVVYTPLGAQYTLTIGDYRGAKYEATIYAQNHNYDLAILKFRKGIEPLSPIPFANSNIDLEQRVAVLGYPVYQTNAITLGNSIDYDTVDLDSSLYEMTNVLFDVLITDAPVKSGSSGSVVINDQYQIVGLVYAGNFTSESETSVYSLAIPLEKILEFFLQAEFDLGGV